MLEQSSAELLHLQLHGTNWSNVSKLAAGLYLALVTCWKSNSHCQSEFGLNLSSQRQLSLLIDKESEDTYIQIPQKWNACFIGLLFTNQHTSLYHHCSLPVYYGFLSDEKQITVLPLSGRKTIFTLKVIEKQSTGRKISIYWHLLHVLQCHTWGDKKGLIRAALFGENHSHLMVFAEHPICHKISEIDSKPSLLGWRSPIRLKNSEGCWKPISSNGVDYWIERI